MLMGLHFTREDSVSNKYGKGAEHFHGEPEATPGSPHPVRGTREVKWRQTHKPWPAVDWADLVWAVGAVRRAHREEVGGAGFPVTLERPS